MTEAGVAPMLKEATAVSSALGASSDVSTMGTEDEEPHWP